MHANGVASDTCFISTGVPQRSILGPLLFIIFINDLPKSSTFFSTRLYADDTSLTASGSDLDSLLCEINNNLPAVYEWLCTNKLTLNLTKTKFLIFMPRQKESYNLYPPLTVTDVHLEKSFFVKYLGVYIDCHLTWHDHIDYIWGRQKSRLPLHWWLLLLGTQCLLINQRLKPALNENVGSEKHSVFFSRFNKVCLFSFTFPLSLLSILGISFLV